MDIDIPYLRCYSDSNINFSANQLYPCDTIISSIDEDSEKSSNVILYPNPTTENISILTSARTNESQLTIYNVTGKFQFRKLVPAGTKNVNVDVSHFGPGSYFFEIRNQAEVESGFFLIY
ncbi:MAG: T9SS type A sorting domain-containing protein [Bacteroidetes bacterium]|nr:T9SS type A sorting domain-containing protein [Bacteroidota bacterium]